MRSRIFILLLVGAAMLSCSPRALHEVQRVVAEADSMRAEGRMYDDSLALAQAYKTLDYWQWFYADDYAHACYHYGRLLREKDNPVEAMQCFINATHSRTCDNRILGRVYNNIGEISYLANEYQLSYDMYSKAAELFLNNGDSLYFCYSLYRMAFEKAVLGDNSQTDSILRIIAYADIDDSTLANCSYITNAEKHLHNQHYDSAIYFAHQAMRFMPDECTGQIILAQAFSYKGRKDSAVYYAERVLAQSKDLGNQNNALYILTNDDMTKDLDFVRKTAAERADIQKLLEIRQGKLSQAVQLLEQDLHRQPDWSGYVVLILLLASVIGAVVLAIIWKKRKQQMQVLADEQANNIVESIKKHVDTKDLNTTLRWKNYDELKTEADLYMGGIVSKLETYHLNEVEIRFCILTLLDFPLKKIADTIYYSYPSAIKTLKKRIADKLSTTPPELKNFLLHLPPKL